MKVQLSKNNNSISQTKGAVMKKQQLAILLLCEAILCILFSLVSQKFFRTNHLLSLPLQPVAQLLRHLSLSGVVGNGIAILLFVFLSLSPLFALAMMTKKRPIQWEDSLLFLLSALLFFAQLGTVNPKINIPVSKAIPNAIPTLYMIGTYAVIGGYISLRFIRKLLQSNNETLYRYLTFFLSAISVLLLANLIFEYISPLLTNYKDTNLPWTIAIPENTDSLLFLVLQYTIAILPSLVSIVLIYFSMDLIQEMQQQRYSEQVVARSKKLTQLSIYGLILLILSNIGYNMLQLLNMNTLSKIQMSAFFPILSILLVLSILIFTKYVEEGTRIKKDNDLFV